jgi:hypothetical protein
MRQMVVARSIGDREVSGTALPRSVILCPVLAVVWLFRFIRANFSLLAVFHAPTCCSVVSPLCRVEIIRDCDRTPVPFLAGLLGASFVE